MFFFFPPNISKKDNYEFSKRDIHTNSKLWENEYFVYGESSWGEGIYSEFSAISIGEFEETKTDVELEIVEKSSSDFRRDNLSKIENPNNFFDKKNVTKISRPPGLRLLSIAEFFYSPKTVKEVFNYTINDWHVEYFEALNKKEIGKARWINVRYTYAFLAAMWQKSPIGDLIEFVSKLAK